MSYMIDTIKGVSTNANESNLLRYAHLNVDSSKIPTSRDKDQFFEVNPTEDRKLAASICSDDVAYESSYSDEIDKHIIKSLQSGTNSEESLSLVKSFHSLIEEVDVNLKDSESSSTFRLKIDTISSSNSSENSNNYLGNLIENFNDTEESSKALIENADNETISKSSDTGSSDDAVRVDVETPDDSECTQVHDDNKLAEDFALVSELPHDKPLSSAHENEESKELSNEDNIIHEFLEEKKLESLENPSVSEYDSTNADSSLEIIEDLSEKEENSFQWKVLLERLAQLQEDLPKLRKELAEAKQRNMELALENWRLATKKGQALWTVDAERARKVTAIAECQNMLAEVDALCSAELDNIQGALRTLEPLHMANSAHFWPPPIDYNFGQLSAALMRRDVLMEVTTSLNVSSADEALENFNIT